MMQAEASTQSADERPPDRGGAPAESESAESAADLEACRNCGAALNGPYCRICGQRHIDGPLTFREIGRQIGRVLFDLEQGLLYTFRKMVVSPGDVARRYLDGERRAFISPVTYYLLAVTVSIVVTHLLWDEIIDAVILNSAQFGATEGLEQSAQNLGFTGGRAIMEFAMGIQLNVLTYVTLLSVAAIGSILRIFLPERTIAEWTIAAMFAISQCLIYSALIQPVMLILPIAGQSFLGFGLQVGMVSWVTSAFGDSRWRSAALGALSTLISFVAIALATAAVISAGLAAARFFDVDIQHLIRSLV